MKNMSSMEKVLGLAPASSTAVIERPGVKIYPYEKGFCHIDLTDEVSVNGSISIVAGRGKLVNGITNNISRLVRSSIPVTQLGLTGPSSFVAHHVEPAGSLRIERSDTRLVVRGTYQTGVELGTRYFTLLEQAFALMGFQLRGLTVRFGTASDDRLMVISLFHHRDWNLWREASRLAGKDKSPHQIVEDYATIDASSEIF